MKMLLLGFSLLVLQTVILNAQNPVDEAIRHAKIIPPSPEAQTFQKYGEYPVDFSTGVPKIDIPIYAIKTAKLSLPISLTYHASGIRVSDVASVVGLGWRLNAGGVFTRSVKGFADENGQGVINHPILTEAMINASRYPSDPGYNATGNFMFNVGYNYQDNESDDYSYFAGDDLSGGFIYDNQLNIVPTSYSPNKIIRHSASNTYPFGFWFEVLKDDGTRYIFNKKELCRVGSDPELYPSSWWLSQIISEDKTDTINFDYEVDNATPHTDISVSQSWDFGLNQYGSGNSGIMFSRTQTNTFQCRLKKISFKTGYVEFAYAQDRIDMQENRLTSIMIFNKLNPLSLKRYEFEQSYFWSGYAYDKYNYRLKLDNIAVYDGNSFLQQKYSFEYNQNNILPPYINPSNYYSYQSASYAIDYFGYYNGQLQNQTLIPNLPTDFSFMSPNRNISSSHAKACILNKITYPAGGSTTFEYSSNVDYQGNLTGGLRIDKIVSTATNSSSSITKRYQYQNNLLHLDLNSYGKYDYQQLYSPNPDYGEYRTIYTDNPIVPYQQFNGSFALYQIVQEFMDDVENNISLRTEYTYESESNIVYSVNSPRYGDEYYIERAWRRGLLQGISYFKYVNGSYIPAKSITNYYDDYRNSVSINGIKIQPYVIRSPSLGSGQCGNSPSQPVTDCFFYFDTKIEVGIKKLTKQFIVETGDNGQSLTTTKNFSYESPFHLFPTQISFDDSKGNALITKNKYPIDFTGNTVYDAMVANNITSPIIEQAMYKNTNFLRSMKTNYNFWSSSGWTIAPSNLIVPQTIESKVGDVAEVRFLYNSYDDNGNVTTISKDKDVKTSYVYDDQSQQLIAQVLNASVADIAYTSFEDDGSGNWTIGSQARQSSEPPPTGKKYYSLGDGNISKSGLTVGKKYIVSYWGKYNSVATVSGGTVIVKTGSTIGTWTYREYEITPTSPTVSISGGALIDELRLYPADAQMTTYTYDPLIGMTSQTDTKNIITYYEYDDFSRLKCIRDRNGAIVKKYEYKYTN